MTRSLLLAALAAAAPAAGRGPGPRARSTSRASSTASSSRSTGSSGRNGRSPRSPSSRPIARWRGCVRGSRSASTGSCSAWAATSSTAARRTPSSLPTHAPAPRQLRFRATPASTWPSCARTPRPVAAAARGPVLHAGPPHRDDLGPRPAAAGRGGDPAGDGPRALQAPGPHRRSGRAAATCSPQEGAFDFSDRETMWIGLRVRPRRGRGARDGRAAGVVRDLRATSSTSIRACAARTPGCARAARWPTTTTWWTSSRAINREGRVEVQLVADYCWNTAVDAEQQGAVAGRGAGLDAHGARGPRVHVREGRSGRDPGRVRRRRLPLGDGLGGAPRDLGIRCRSLRLHAVAQWQRFKDAPVAERDRWLYRYRLEAVSLGLGGLRGQRQELRPRRGGADGAAA